MKLAKPSGQVGILEEAGICTFICMYLHEIRRSAPFAFRTTLLGVREPVLVTSLAEPHTCQRSHPSEKLALGSHQGTLTPGATLVDSSGDGLSLLADHSRTPLAAVGSECKVGYESTRFQDKQTHTK